MFNVLFFAFSICFLSQVTGPKPPSETGQKTSVPKITINNKEIKSDKPARLPAGSTIKLTKDPNTGDFVVSINSDGNLKKRRTQPANIVETTGGLSSQDTQNIQITPDAIINSLSKQEIEIQGDQYKTIRLEASDGRTHFITTLAIGTLDVFYSENIRSDRSTRLEASLTLNQVIPEAIKQLGDQSPISWFVKAEYNPQNNTDYFSAKLNTELEQRILDTNQTIRWQWTINPKPGFENDTANLLLKVIYKTEAEQSHEQEIAHKEIKWVEKKSPSIVQEFGSSLKEYAPALLAIVLTVAGLATIPWQYQKAKAEGEKAKAEAKKAMIETSASKAKSSQLEKEKAALAKRLNELEAQLKKWKLRNWSYYSLSRLRRMKHLMKGKNKIN